MQKKMYSTEYSNQLENLQLKRSIITLRNNGLIIS